MTSANIPDPVDPSSTRFEGLAPSAAEPSASGAPGQAGRIDRMAHTAHKAVDKVADKIEPTREKLHESVEQAAAAVKARADRLDNLQDEWLTSARSCVRE